MVDLKVSRSEDDGLRCPWGRQNQATREYHDRRWCQPVHDDAELFAWLVLESLSVGLSFSLILQREDAIRAACDGLDPVVCARYGSDDVERLMKEEGLIHNRRKLESIGNNARLSGGPTRIRQLQ